MGIKGEVGGGFPQPKPAFTALFGWEVEDVYAIDRTTHPKNQLNYTKFQGSIKSVQGSGLPQFEAIAVDAGMSTQEEHLPSGEAWMKGDATALFRVIKPPGSSVDPETESGLFRIKWTVLGMVPRLQDILNKDRDFGETIMNKLQIQGVCVGSMSFTTGDSRFKFLEHAVYVGKCRLVVIPTEGSVERPRFSVEYKISYVAA